MSNGIFVGLVLEAIVLKKIYINFLGLWDHSTGSNFEDDTKHYCCKL